MPTLVACFVRALHEVWDGRGVLWALARRDVLLQHRQKVLGMAGAFLQPLLALASFWFLHAAGVLTIASTDVPYPVFLFAGTFLWGIFVLGVQRGSAALIAQGDLLLRTGLSRIVVVLAAYATILPGLAMQWLLLGVLLLACGIWPSWLLAVYPLLALPLLFVGMGVALALAPLAVVVRELPSLMGTLLNFLLYLTPVIYHAHIEQAWLRDLSVWNPLALLVDGPRRLALEGTLFNPLGCVVACGLSVFVLALGVRCFYAYQDRIAERL